MKTRLHDQVFQILISPEMAHLMSLELRRYIVSIVFKQENFSLLNIRITLKRFP